MSKRSSGAHNHRAQQKRQRRNARQARDVQRNKPRAVTRSSSHAIGPASVADLLRGPRRCAAPCVGTTRYVEGSDRRPTAEQLGVFPDATVVFDRACDACGKVIPSMLSEPEIGGLGDGGIQVENMEDFDEAAFATFADFFPPGEAPERKPKPGPLFCDRCETQVVAWPGEGPALDGTDEWCPSCEAYATEPLPAQCDATRFMDGQIVECMLDLGHEGQHGGEHGEWEPPSQDCRAVAKDKNDFPIQCGGTKGHPGHHFASGRYYLSKKLVTYNLEWIGERPAEAKILSSLDGREVHN